MTPSQLNATAALYEAAAIKNYAFASALHGYGRHEEGFEMERRAEGQEARACALREEAAQLEAVRALIEVAA